MQRIWLPVSAASRAASGPGRRTRHVPRGDALGAVGHPAGRGGMQQDSPSTRSTSTSTTSRVWSTDPGRRRARLRRDRVHPSVPGSSHPGRLPAHRRRNRLGQRVVAGSQEHLGGVFSMDGQMVDGPVLKQARAVLAQWEPAGLTETPPMRAGIAIIAMPGNIGGV